MNTNNKLPFGNPQDQLQDNRPPLQGRSAPTLFNQQQGPFGSSGIITSPINQGAQTVMPPFGRVNQLIPAQNQGLSQPNLSLPLQNSGPVIPGQRMIRMAQFGQGQLVSGDDQNNQEEVQKKKQMPFHITKQIRKQNRKNIANGEIILNQIDPADKVEADTDVTDYDDTLLGVLDLEAVITKTFIENLKSGEFIEVSEQYIKQRMQNLKEESYQKSQTENLFLELNKLIHTVIRILDRFIFFFQGLLGGLSMMHLVVIYLDTNRESLLSSYSRIALKIDQVFHLMAFISCFGSFFQTMQIKKQADQSQQPKDKKFYLQSFFSTVFYGIAYLITVINHKFIALISDSLPELELNSSEYKSKFKEYDSDFQIWQVLQVIITALTILGWYISVNTTESNLNYMSQFEKIESEDATNDAKNDAKQN